MRNLWIIMAGLLMLTQKAESAANRVLEHADVVMMYQAERQTYTNYGTTVLAWGGKPNPNTLAEAKDIKFFGSVGMVTEFNGFFRRFGAACEQAFCCNVDGLPVKVPWLTDHQYNGVPYYWCCTQQPLFRQYIQERVVQTIQAGAYGVHIDDHLGTSGGLFVGICFCPKCVEGFSLYLKSLPAAKKKQLGVSETTPYDFKKEAKNWVTAGNKRKVQDHPLWQEWSIYQSREAAKFMMELRELAAKTAGRPVPVGANAGLLWPRHLSDYKAVDLFSAEIDHQAHSRQATILPLFAYRLADAMERPLASTASGQDWAFIKENNLHGLVRGWIALSYAAGNCLMAPHYQWCYTAEKGTHWYFGPMERFAPLYQFVRKNAAWLNGFENFADLGVVLPHADYVKNTSRWFEINRQLTEANYSYRLFVGSDEIVDHPLTAQDLKTCKAYIIPERKALMSSDYQLLEQQKELVAFQDVSQAIKAVQPSIRVDPSKKVLALPRVKSDKLALHLINREYDSSKDDFSIQSNVIVQIQFARLGMDAPNSCRLIAPGKEPLPLKVNGDKVEIPSLELWGILAFERTRP